MAILSLLCLSGLWLLVQAVHFTDLSSSFFDNALLLDADMRGTTRGFGRWDHDPRWDWHWPAAVGALLGASVALGALLFARRLSPTTLLFLAVGAYAAPVGGFVRSWRALWLPEEHSVQSLTFPVEANLRAIACFGIGLAIVGLLVGIAWLRRERAMAPVSVLLWCSAAVAASVTWQLERTLNFFFREGFIWAHGNASAVVREAASAVHSSADESVIWVLAMVAAIVAVVAWKLGAPPSARQSLRGKAISSLTMILAVALATFTISRGVPLARETSVPLPASPLWAAWHDVPPTLIPDLHTPWIEGLSPHQGKYAFLTLDAEPDGSRMTWFEVRRLSRYGLGETLSLDPLDERLADLVERANALGRPGGPVAILASASIAAAEVLTVHQLVVRHGLAARLVLARATSFERPTLGPVHVHELVALPALSAQQIAAVRTGETYGDWLLRTQPAK